MSLACVLFASYGRLCSATPPFSTPSLSVSQAFTPRASPWPLLPPYTLMTSRDCFFTAPRSMHGCTRDSPSPSPFLLPPRVFAGYGNLIAICAPDLQTVDGIRVLNVSTSSHQTIPCPMIHPSIIHNMCLFYRDDDEDDYHLVLYDDEDDHHLVLDEDDYHLVLYDDEDDHHLVLYGERVARFALLLCIYTSNTKSWRTIRRRRQTVPNLHSFNAAEANLFFWDQRTRELSAYCLQSGECCMIKVAFSLGNEEQNEEASKQRYVTGDGNLKCEGNQTVSSLENVYLTGHCVFKCQGDMIVLVFAVVIDDKLSASSKLKWCQVKGFQVWKLVSTTSCGNVGGTTAYSWVQVASSPPFCWDAYYVEAAELPFEPKFVHDGTSICMTGAKHTSSQESSDAFSQNKLGRYKPPLIYNMELHTWSYLSHHSEEIEDAVGLFGFRPTFGALAKLYRTTAVQEQSQAEIEPMVF